jgi:hypothetical protein
VRVRHAAVVLLGVRDLPSDLLTAAASGVGVVAICACSAATWASAASRAFVSEETWAWSVAFCASRVLTCPVAVASAVFALSRRIVMLRSCVRSLAFALVSCAISAACAFS